jgi:cytochrome c biogenesis protein CcmG/thiol:disulfide interchange protein DsbE
MARTVIPLVVFILLAVLLYAGLDLNPRDIPSPLIGKQVPQFQLPQVDDPKQSFSSDDLKGKVSLVNAWASWCVTCRSEHHVLMQLSKNDVPIYGIDYKDERKDALSYLQKLGNPYVKVGHDLDGQVGINFGVIATPETFVVDKKGVIRYKQTGAITTKAWNEKIAPLIERLKKEQG